MSQHILPTSLRIDPLLTILAAEIRPHDGVVFSGIGDVLPAYVVFNPDLTADEQTRLTNVINKVLAAQAVRLSDLDNVPNWATYTGQQAQDTIHSAIFGGQDAVTIKANIDAQLTDITTANVSQINIRLAAIRTLLGNVVDVIIAIRTILENMGKLLAYIRDIALK